MKLNIAVLMGGVSNEHEVSLKSGAMVVDALDREKYDVVPVTITKEGGWLLPPKDVPLYGNGAAGKSETERHTFGEALDRLKSGGTDVVFILLHGANGEDGTMQGALELAGLAYTGSGVAASALSMDKRRTSELLAYHGLSIPRQRSLQRSEWELPEQLVQTLREHFPLPMVVKPSRSGSSVGVSIVREAGQINMALEEAFRHDDEVIVQQFIAGDEITVPVLEDEEGRPSALPPIRIVPKNATFFDYRAKYTPGASEETTELGLSESIVQVIKAAGVTAHTVLGCAGMSRTDLIVASDGAYVLETNTIPGMTETSLLPQSAKAAGIAFSDLLDRIIRSALRRKEA